MLLPPNFDCIADCVAFPYAVIAFGVVSESTNAAPTPSLCNNNVVLASILLEKLEPAIVTLVPPEGVPTAGVMDETVGAAAAFAIPEPDNTIIPITINTSPRVRAFDMVFGIRLKVMICCIVVVLIVLGS